MLIVEDGSKVAGAESYASVADADAYWLARNNSTWAAATNSAKEAALREAAMYLDNAFKWVGNRISQTQVMSWPRYVQADLDKKQVLQTEVPLRVVQAQCELALEALGGRLDPTLERGGQVTSESVGPISVTYAVGAPGRKRFPFVAMMLKDLIYGDASSISADAVRA